MGNTGDFLSQIVWWKYDIYWLLKSSCFKLFGDGKYGLSLNQKFDLNVIFTCYFELSLTLQNLQNMVFLPVAQVALQRCSYEKVFWKYTAENITGEHPCRKVILIKPLW